MAVSNRQGASLEQLQAENKFVSKVAKHVQADIKTERKQIKQQLKTATDPKQQEQLKNRYEVLNEADNKLTVIRNDCKRKEFDYNHEIQRQEAASGQTAKPSPAQSPPKAGAKGKEISSIAKLNAIAQSPFLKDNPAVILLMLALNTADYLAKRNQTPAKRSTLAPAAAKPDAAAKPTAPTPTESKAAAPAFDREKWYPTPKNKEEYKEFREKSKDVIKERESQIEQCNAKLKALDEKKIETNGKDFEGAYQAHSEEVNKLNAEKDAAQVFADAEKAYVKQMDEQFKDELEQEEVEKNAADDAEQNSVTSSPKNDGDNSQFIDDKAEVQDEAEDHNYGDSTNDELEGQDETNANISQVAEPGSTVGTAPTPQPAASAEPEASAIPKLESQPSSQSLPDSQNLKGISVPSEHAEEDAEEHKVEEAEVNDMDNNDDPDNNDTPTPGGP